MVGNIPSVEVSPGPVEITITNNHGISPRALRELIKGSLDPLLVDPVPSRVVIEDIVVKKDEEGVLSISCEVKEW